MCNLRSVKIGKIKGSQIIAPIKHILRIRKRTVGG